MAVSLLKNKYTIIFLTQIKNLLAYRMNIMLKLVRPLLMTAAIAALWHVLFRIKGENNIGGFTYESFIIYLLTVRFIAVFSPGGASIQEMNEEIRTGNITMRLVRPMHYMLWLFLRNLPVPLTSGIIGIAMVSILAYFLGADVPTGYRSVLFFFSVIATVLIQYAFYQGIGILSFWIYEINSIERLYKSISTLLSGEFVPLALFGSGSLFLQFTPLAALAHIPGTIFTNNIISLEMATWQVVSQYVWAIIMWSGLIKLYCMGLKKFEAQGG